MSGLILTGALFIAQTLIAIAIVMAGYRALRGPRAQDRVMALDAVYVNVMLLLITLGLRTGSVFFFEASLIIAILGFVATVSLAKFLMRGEVIE